jgi:hypothetical protein
MNEPLETIPITSSGSPPPLSSPESLPGPFIPITPPGSPPPLTSPGSLLGSPQPKHTTEYTHDAFRALIGRYLSNPATTSHERTLNSELEAKFGTIRYSKHTNTEQEFTTSPFITKSNYDNVIKKIRSVGFTSDASSEMYRLSISSEVNTGGGKTYMSNVRTEIHGVSAIEQYCRTDSIDDIVRKFPQSVAHVQKSFPDPVQKPPGSEQPFNPNQIDFSDFNFRITYKIENSKPRDMTKIVSNWKRAKKTFRLINRVSFTHPKYPTQIDLSIVKSTNVPNHSVSRSRLFTQPERYEIEIEIDNQKVIKELFSEEDILSDFRKTIRYVSAGVQTTSYPVSYPEQSEVLLQYYKLIKVHNESIKPGFNKLPPFIGPSQYTLQTENAAEQDDNLQTINIRSDFVVTEKADGERRLAIITNSGRIFFFDTKMNVIFSGAVTSNKRFYSSIVDGEYIAHNKHGDFINLYLAFDVYFIHGETVRNKPFIYSQRTKRKDDSVEKSRYELLIELMKEINPKSVVGDHKPSPVRFDVKRFLPSGLEPGERNTIFGACNTILKVNKDNYEYTTDGLIFTHATFGVGGAANNTSSVPSNAPWEYSFKWKPSDQNTVDFKVTTAKNSSGSEIITSRALIPGGPINDVKTIILMCSFNPQRDGYENACADVMNIPYARGSYKPAGRKNDNNQTRTKGAVDQRFFPTQPYDATAGITHIPLKQDSAGHMQMFAKDGDMFENNSIVEFAYELDPISGGRWVPLRVRHDKVRSNAYTTANNNWRSIHNPLTETMISTGLNIPKASISSDVYYNKVGGSTNTERMKNFHNLYVKHHLIAAAASAASVSGPEITLIDYACGKAGDLAKWTNSRVSFVLGIDIAKDNLTNRYDGACARYLSVRSNRKDTPHAIFLHGDSSKNIKSGKAYESNNDVAISHQLFGISPINEAIGIASSSAYGIGAKGFDVSSCQFAMHYMFQSTSSLFEFVQNLSECTALGGHFIGTAYDGEKIFSILKSLQPGHGDRLVSPEGVKIWEVIRDYSETITEFPATSKSLGLQILVYQESINQLIPEFLVNFEYFDMVMRLYGFELITPSDIENISSGAISSGNATFGELFSNMTKTNQSQYKNSQKYKDARNMSAAEKHISFLNRIVMYKKIRHVDNPSIPHEDEEFVVDDTPVPQDPPVKQIGEKNWITPINMTVLLKEDTKFIQTRIKKKKTKKNKT